MKDKKRPLKEAGIALTHHGDNYWKIEVNGKESEIEEFEGQVIQELMKRLQDIANVDC